MAKKFLLLSDDFNRFGYVPRSRQFVAETIKRFGTLKKGENEYCFIEFESGCAELIRYDEKGKKWAMLCFPAKSEAAA
jgi:hypothetical protein